MKQVSVKTLLLLAELLLVVVICHLAVWAPSAGAAVTRLDVPDEVVDPNEVQDPNENPQPECVVSAGIRVWLDDEPLDPNAPDEPENPQPECIKSAGVRVWLDDEPLDPNAPDEPENPQPEATVGVPAAWGL